MLLTGVDEAGYGPLAGPMVVCAVTLTCPPIDFDHPKAWWPIPEVQDSKKLSWAQKLDAFDRIMEFFREEGGSFQVAWGSVEEIRTGHNWAYQRALTRVANLAEAWKSDLVIMDGQVGIPVASLTQRAIPKADQNFFAVAAASVIAKVLHDEDMLRLDKEFPQYGFRNHRGYGSPEHLLAIKEHGFTVHHRPSARNAMHKIDASLKAMAANPLRKPRK